MFTDDRVIDQNSVTLVYKIVDILTMTMKMKMTENLYLYGWNEWKSRCMSSYRTLVFRLQVRYTTAA